jgi:hypothetical protein
MAQFRATIKGQRGEVSRLGSRKTGLSARVNGWNLGVQVEAEYDADFDRDVFTMYLTGGSNQSNDRVLIGTFTQDSRDALRDARIQGALQTVVMKGK